MLPRTNNKINLFGSFMNGIFSLKPEFGDVDIFPDTLWMVIQLIDLIIHHMTLTEVGCAFLQGGRCKGLPHAGLNKGIVNIVVATAARLNANILHRIVMIKVSRMTWIGFSR